MAFESYRKNYRFIRKKLFHMKLLTTTTPRGSAERLHFTRTCTCPVTPGIL